MAQQLTRSISLQYKTFVGWCFVRTSIEYRNQKFNDPSRLSVDFWYKDPTFLSSVRNSVEKDLRKQLS